LAVAATLAALAVAGCGESGAAEPQNRFDGKRAVGLVKRQVAVGQRPAGSPQLRRLATKLRRRLPDGRFERFRSTGPQRGLRNVVGTLPGPGPAILVGAHYDTEWHPKGVVGANDSAAGTAAVIELARSLPAALPSGHREIRFVLFDGEEDPPGCSDANFQFCALRGSRAYAAAHPGEIGEVIVLDYIAHRGASFPREGNSSEELWARLREAAEQIGTAALFPPGTGSPPVLDDHIPFLDQEVPSIDVIDFSYRYADTVKDTPNKLDRAVLDQVGETVGQLVINLSGRPAS
jgi:glutaminyl-peptide cyclotransferase